MNFIKRLFKKDEFLEEIKRNSGLYQLFFVKLVKTINDKIYAKVFLGRNIEVWESDEFKKEDDKLFEVLKEGEKKGLNGIVLFTIFLQYATADPLFDQDAKKSYWVSVVQNRKLVDSFPHHNAIISNINVMYKFE